MSVLILLILNDEKRLTLKLVISHLSRYNKAKQRDKAQRYSKMFAPNVCNGLLLKFHTFLEFSFSLKILFGFI